MRYLILFVAVLTFCFSISVVQAQNKVVVVPLCSKDKKPEPEISVATSAGQVWMALNLGASQVATSSADPASYGTLYQWGRFSDGHEYRSSSTTSTLSTSDAPGHGRFILPPLEHFDWRSPGNDNLWQGVFGINNPCPAGFRLPTESEWQIERQSWTSNNAAGAFASPLKLSLAGYREWVSSNGGNVEFTGIKGFYWSSTVNYDFIRALSFDMVYADLSNYYRPHGFSVRCIKD